MLKRIIMPLLIINLTACGTPWKMTPPEQTALDQMLLSTAAERAANISNSDEQGRIINNWNSRLGKTFIDGRSFTYQQQYAVQAVKRYFLDNGVSLVDDIKQADTILEVSSGALSVDNNESFVGIPKLGLPIPLAGQLSIPEVPLYKKETNRALAKFSMSFKDAQTGKEKLKSIAKIGTAQVEKWHIFLLFHFTDNDLNLPKEYKGVDF